MFREFYFLRSCSRCVFEESNPCLSSREKKLNPVASAALDVSGARFSFNIESQIYNTLMHFLAPFWTGKRSKPNDVTVPNFCSSVHDNVPGQADRSGCRFLKEYTDIVLGKEESGQSFTLFGT